MLSCKTFVLLYRPAGPVTSPEPERRHTVYIVFLLILGGLAGWLAATLVKGHGLGLWGNIGVGVLGALLGGSLLGQVGVRLAGPFGQGLTAFLGALVLLWVAGLFAKK